MNPSGNLKSEQEQSVVRHVVEVHEKKDVLDWLGWCQMENVYE